jgi:hypothetical protein
MRKTDLLSIVTNPALVELRLRVRLPDEHGTYPTTFVSDPQPTDPIALVGDAEVTLKAVAVAGHIVTTEGPADAAVPIATRTHNDSHNPAPAPSTPTTVDAERENGAPAQVDEHKQETEAAEWNELAALVGGASSSAVEVEGDIDGAHKALVDRDELGQIDEPSNEHGQGEEASAVAPSRAGAAADADHAEVNTTADAVSSPLSVVEVHRVVGQRWGLTISAGTGEYVVINVASNGAAASVGDTLVVGTVVSSIHAICSIYKSQPRPRPARATSPPPPPHTRTPFTSPPKYLPTHRLTRPRAYLLTRNRWSPSTALKRRRCQIVTSRTLSRTRTSRL